MTIKFDPRLTREQMRLVELAQKLLNVPESRFDPDKDGIATRTEVLSFLKSLPHNIYDLAGAQVAKWLTTKGSVTEAQLDLNHDGNVTLDEAAAFVFKSPRWQELLPGLDLVGIKHPLDTRNFPKVILDRIASLREKVERKIGKKPGDKGYCDAFVPAFYKKGFPQIGDGGLCFGYPTRVVRKNTGIEPELTAQEAFEGCLDYSRPYGSCTEATYKVQGAFLAAGVPCEIDAIDTAHHLFPRYKNTDLDPSGIGKIGCERKVNPAVIYHAQPGNKNGLEEAAEIAEPSTAPNWEKINDLILKKDYDAAFDKIDRRVSADSKDLIPFKALELIAQILPAKDAEELALRVLTRWPNSPYASYPLNGAIRKKENIDRIASEIEKILPRSGWSQTVKLLEASMRGDAKAVRALAEEALRLNPQCAAALYFIALGKFIEGRIAEAKNYLERSMEIAPNYSQSHFLMARILQSMGDLEGALKESDKEYLTSYDTASSLLLKAQLELNMGNPKDALDDLKQYLRYRLPGTDVYLYTVQALTQMGEIDYAREYMHELLNYSYKDNPGLFYPNAALLEMLDMNLGEAKAYAERIDGLQYPVSKALTEIWIMLSSNDIDGAESALNYYENVLRELPTAVATIRGDIEFARGNFEGAREAYDYVSEKEKHNIVSRYNSISLDIYEGETEAARQKIAYLEARYPDQYIIHWLRPLLHLREGDYKMALREYAIIKEEHPTARSPHTELTIHGFAMLGTGDLDGASKIATELVQKKPNDPLGWLLSARVAFNRGRIREAMELATKAKELEHFDNRDWPLMSADALLEEIASKKK